MNPHQKRSLVIGGTVAALGGLLAMAFYPDDPFADGPLSVPDLRQRALDLCALYLPCFRGDAHYREICKDFGGVGTTCGYLPAWMLFRLGCRDARLVNRGEPAAGLTYRVGMNIADLVQGGKALGAWHAFIPGLSEPEPGDPLYFQGADFAAGGGGNAREHVAVLASLPTGGVGASGKGGQIVTYDLGHSIQPEGSLTSRTISAGGVVAFLGSSRKLVGFVSLAEVPFTAEPDLTDHTTLAVA